MATGLRAQTYGLGSVAQNILEPVLIVNSFLFSTCIVLGVSFLFASIIKYIEHRRSPLLVPISTVVFLVVAGIVLILLPFLPLLTGHNPGD